MSEKAPVPTEEIKPERPKNPAEAEEDFKKSLSEAEQLDKDQG